MNVQKGMTCGAGGGGRGGHCLREVGGSMPVAKALKVRL